MAARKNYTAAGPTRPYILRDKGGNRRRPCRCGRACAASPSHPSRSTHRLTSSSLGSPHYMHYVCIVMGLPQPTEEVLFQTCKVRSAAGASCVRGCRVRGVHVARIGVGLGYAGSVGEPPSLAGVPSRHSGRAYCAAAHLRRHHGVHQLTRTLCSAEKRRWAAMSTGGDGGPQLNLPIPSPTLSMPLHSKHTAFSHTTGTDSRSEPTVRVHIYLCVCNVSTSCGAKNVALAVMVRCPSTVSCYTRGYLLFENPTSGCWRERESEQ